MKKLWVSVLTVCLLFTCGCADSSQTADVIYTNAKIYTSNADQPYAEAMAVKDGKLLYVGEAKNLKKMTGKDTKVIDLNGKFITPTFLDAHSHPGIVGTTVWYEDMPQDCDTKEEILAYVKDYCEEHSVEEVPYVYFEYYPSDLFGEEGPRKEWIDEVVSDRPILIEDFSDHACWVNSKFLELMGVYTPGTVKEFDEENFIKDASGDYTGWIKEGVWQNYIDNVYEAVNWYPEESVTEETLLYTLDDFTKWGVTGVMDAYCLGEDHAKEASELVSSGKWPGYYELSCVMDEPALLEDTIAQIHELQEKYGNDHFSVDTLKIFYDGTNELGNAALIDGWIDDPSQHGYVMMDTEETKNVIARCNEENIDVHFHMVGDLAFRQVMDAVEELQKEVGELKIQVEVCHCECVDPADYDRPAKLGVIVNWTPHWSGGYFGDGSLRYLGQERFDRMYQFNPMIESGAIVTFGSDIYSAYEEHRANPYFSMQTGMTRVDIDYPDGERASADAKLSLDSLLKGYTINAAIQMRIDDRTGSLEAGKNADFIVFDTDLFTVDPYSFKDVMPTAVYYEGNLISGGLAE